MYFHLIILAFYTVFLASLTANTIYLGHREDDKILTNITSAHRDDYWTPSVKANWTYVSSRTCSAKSKLTHS
jgi:hypothetical protein